jgi:hypothetical protein
VSVPGLEERYVITESISGTVGFARRRTFLRSGIYGRNMRGIIRGSGRCGICKKTKMLVIQKGTSSALRHLKKDHKINKQGRRIRTDQMITVEAATIVAQTIAQVVSRFNANTFRYLSQLQYLAMGLSRPMGYPWARQAFLAGL